jgi:hypothetical protein
MFVIWFLVKRSNKESWANLHPLQCGIQSQEEEIQPEEMDAINHRTGGPNPEIIVFLITRRLSSVGIVERHNTSKISARVYIRDTRRK